MFKIRRIKALQDNTSSRNLANEFINKQGPCATLIVNKRHAMHAEAMTFHKGSLIIFRTFVKKLGYIKVTDNFCAE